MSGKFSSAQKNWHISSRELYPIVFAFRRLDYLLYGHTLPVELFTDHRNLVFIVRPESSIKKAHIDRLQRWSLLFQDANIIIRHIDGERNAAADLLSRWGYFGDDREVEDVVENATEDDEQPPAALSVISGTVSLQRSMEIAAVMLVRQSSDELKFIAHAQQSRSDFIFDDRSIDRSLDRSEFSGVQDSQFLPIDTTSFAYNINHDFFSQ